MKYIEKRTDQVYNYPAVERKFRQLSPATILKKYIPEDCREEINKDINITALDKKIFNYFLEKEFIAIKETYSTEFEKVIKQTFNKYPSLLYSFSPYVSCAHCPYKYNGCNREESTCRAYLEAWATEN